MGKENLMKKIICYLLLSAMLINGFALNSNASKVYGAEPCSDCTVEPSIVTNEWIDESGNEVKMFEENVEVTYLKNDDIIIRDYGHNYDDAFDIQNTGRTRIAWIMIAKVIWSAVGVCSAVYYVTGTDACRIALRYLGTKKKNLVKYELTGRFIPGKIPGCEPSYSGPCNSGYWEYRVARS